MYTLQIQKASLLFFKINDMKLILAIFFCFSQSVVMLAGSNATSKFPEFSWDKIQLYFHGRKATAYTNDELLYLSKFPLITLEKTTGSGTYNTTEEGSIQAARAIKTKNPNAKILYYRNVIVHYGTYGANTALNSITDPFLKDRITGEVIPLVGTNPGYDLTRADVRKWWVDHCKYMSNQPEIDGIFVDGNIKVLTDYYLLNELGKTKKNNLITGYGIMMDSLKANINPSKLNYANIIRASIPNTGTDYMHYFDGSYLENFIGNRDYIAEGIAAAQTIARQGKIVSFTFFIDENLPVTIPVDDKGYVILSPEHQILFDFYLAIYLICAEEYSYFLVTENYDVNPGKNRFWLSKFAEYDKPLGSPKANAIRNGYVYTRQFQNASVTLNLNTMTGTVTWLNTTDVNAAKDTKRIIGYSSDKKLILKTSQSQQVNIYNTLGSKVWSGNVGSDAVEIPLPAGVYIIKEFNQRIINK